MTFSRIRSFFACIFECYSRRYIPGGIHVFPFVIFFGGGGRNKGTVFRQQTPSSYFFGGGCSALLELVGKVGGLVGGWFLFKVRVLVFLGPTQGRKIFENAVKIYFTSFFCVLQNAPPPSPRE